MNTITTAFFNERTVLFTSYNNHPIDGVVDKLSSMEYHGRKIPFPVIRLGNQEKLRAALVRMKQLYEETRQIRIFDKTLDRNREDRIARAKQLSVMLKRYEDILELKERGETISRLLEYNRQFSSSPQMLPFEADLEGRQLAAVDQQIKKTGEVSEEKLIVLSNTKNLERLHKDGQEDDLYDLVQYVRTNGSSSVTPKAAKSRALGVKPFSSATEEAFLQTLNHALGNIWLSQNRFTVEKEVAVSQVFEDNVNYSDLFYSGRFDFVVYEKNGEKKYPVLVIELDGKEHYEDEIVMARDQKKQAICQAHQMELVRVENSYARRYQHVKRILETYFKVRR